MKDAGFVIQSLLVSWVMFYFYIALWYMLLPLLFVFRCIDSVKLKSFNAGDKERFGFYAKNHEKQVIWVHAASVGEVEAAHVLIEYLRKNYPYRVLVTTGTKSGYERVRGLQGDNVDHVYLPYDILVFR